MNQPQTPDNEVARLRWDKETLKTSIKCYHICIQNNNKQIEELEATVARLEEQLDQAVEALKILLPRIK